MSQTGAAASVVSCVAEASSARRAELVAIADFDDFRTKTRSLLATRVPPEAALLCDAGNQQQSLFGLLPAAESGRGGESIEGDRARAGELRLPKKFFPLAKHAACHRDKDRWALLYRVAYRLLYEDRNLLQIAADPDTARLLAMDASVRRDVHKMHAFVRFRRVAAGEGEDARYIAFHRPDHRIVRVAAPFFAERFAALRFSILTPDECAHWDGEQIEYSPGVTSRDAPSRDELEDLWRAYYRATFNPARVRVRAMKAELPVRHWATLPEAEIIEELVREAPARVSSMLERQAPAASPADVFVPTTRSLTVLREAAVGCQGCDLHERATQTVFGEGPESARVMLVGEQPGDREDIEGRPFVGPAGRLLDEVLAEVGLDRSTLYVTNAVKHFKFQQETRGARRIHQKPAYGEIRICSSWLRREVELVEPEVIVCLGASAAQSFMGSSFRLTRSRGQVLEDTPWAPRWMATHHPAALLRMESREDQARATRELADDLGKVAQWLRGATALAESRT